MHGGRGVERVLNGLQVGFFFGVDFMRFDFVLVFFGFAEFFFVTLNGTILSRDLWRVFAFLRFLWSTNINMNYVIFRVSCDVAMLIWAGWVVGKGITF